MEHNSDIFQNGIIIEFLYIFPANQNFALLHIIEPGDQLNHGTFTGTRLSHKGHAFTIFNFEIDALQYIGLAITAQAAFSVSFGAIHLVGKPNIPKFNIVIFGKVRSPFINRNIQYLFGLGNSVQHIGKISPQFLQGADFRQIHGTHIDEQQKCAG